MLKTCNRFSQMHLFLRHLVSWSGPNLIFPLIFPLIFDHLWRIFPWNPSIPRGSSRTPWRKSSSSSVACCVAMASNRRILQAGLRMGYTMVYPLWWSLIWYILIGNLIFIIIYLPYFDYHHFGLFDCWRLWTATRCPHVFSSQKG